MNKRSNRNGAGVALVVLLTGAFWSTVSAQALTLEEAIRLTCVNSDSVKMMKETMKKSDQVIREQWAAAWPKASLNVYGGRTSPAGAGAKSDNAGSFLIDTTGHPDAPQDARMIGGMLSGLTEAMKPKEMEVYSTSIQITQPIYTFGKIDEAVKVASEYDSAIHQTYNRNIQTLQLGALDAFFAGLLFDKQVQVNERSLLRKQEYAEFLDRNFSMGSGVKAQLLAAKADVKGQIATLITLRQNSQAMKMNINLMLGRQITDPLELDTNTALPTVTTVAVPSEVDAMNAAWVNRGDYRALEYMRRANVGGSKIFKAMYLPSIAASVSAGTSATELKKVVDWESRTWSVGLILNWMFFDGFANSAKSAQYTSDSKRLETIRGTFKKMIESEIRTSLREYASSDSNLIAYEEMLAAASESYELTSSLFKQGSGQLSELQRSEEMLRLAELGVINARYRQLRSRAALQVSMGNEIVKLEDK